MTASLKITVLVFASVVITSIGACNRDKDKKKEPVEEEPIKVTSFGLCDNECVFARDGECDDGGYGSKTNYCSFGHDCDDCGDRITVEVVK